MTMKFGDEELTKKTAKEVIKKIEKMPEIERAALTLIGMTQVFGQTMAEVQELDKEMQNESSILLHLGRNVMMACACAAIEYPRIFLPSDSKEEDEYMEKVTCSLLQFCEDGLSTMNKFGGDIDKIMDKIIDEEKDKRSKK